MRLMPTFSTGSHFLMYFPSLSYFLPKATGEYTLKN